MAYDKTVWMYIGEGLYQSSLQINYHRINGVGSFTYIVFWVNAKGLANDAAKIDILKAKRQLVKLKHILRSRALSIKTRAKILLT